eukprot:TRINITY_DN1594_c0_g1_i11.p1 TRINITY_DN1594_c0_g1~~TRINITY_DN1594_c0_g1_i11.p1  ORF type:complete len:234 (+),score=17.27 TRINITY_DN1594_c0_g1_i11:1677-2378(+)
MLTGHPPPNIMKVMSSCYVCVSSGRNARCKTMYPWNSLPAVVKSTVERRVGGPPEETAGVKICLSHLREAGSQGWALDKRGQAKECAAYGFKCPHVVSVNAKKNRKLESIPSEYSAAVVKTLEVPDYATGAVVCHACRMTLTHAQSKSPAPKRRKQDAEVTPLKASETPMHEQAETPQLPSAVETPARRCSGSGLCNCAACVVIAYAYDGLNPEQKKDVMDETGSVRHLDVAV